MDASVKSVNTVRIASYILGFLLMFFNFNVILNLFIAMVVVVFALLLPLSYVLFLYLFLFQWELSLSLPVIGTLNTLVAIVLFIRILLNYGFRHISIGLNKLNIVLLSILSMYSLVDLLVHSQCRLRCTLDFIILIYVYRVKRKSRFILDNSI